MKAMRAVLFLVASSSHGLQATPGSKVARGCRGGGVSQVSLGGVAVPGGEWYANELKSAPMRTRMWTSGAIAGGGDGARASIPSGVALAGGPRLGGGLAATGILASRFPGREAFGACGAWLVVAVWAGEAGERA